VYLVLEGKTWVSLYLTLVFSHTLDRPKKFEWYIYQFFLSLLLWMLGHRPPFHTRTRTEPGQARVVRAHDLQTRMQLRSRGSWNCYILKIIFCLSELTPSFWEKWLEYLTRNDSRALDLGIIPEYLDSEWSRSGPRALGPQNIPELRLSPEVLHCFNLQRFLTRYKRKYERAKLLQINGNQPEHALDLYEGC